MITEKTFIAFWVLWNLSWALPYSFTWMYFHKTDKKFIASIFSMMVILVGIQVVLPLIGFEHFFGLENYTAAAIVGTFVLICIPNAVSNFLVPKLSSTKFGMVYVFTPLCVMTLIAGQVLQANYLQGTVFSRDSMFSFVAYPVVAITYCLFIRFFLLKGSVKGWKTKNIMHI